MQLGIVKYPDRLNLGFSQWNMLRIFYWHSIFTTSFFKSQTFDFIFVDPCRDVEGQIPGIKGARGETGQYGSWSTTVESQGGIVL